MSERILYISGRCEYSKKILLGIQQHTFLKSLFRIVNIDREPFPNYLKTVPAIFIHNQLITGDKVFEYLGKIVEGKLEQEKREQNSTNKVKIIERQNIGLKIIKKKG